MDTKLRSDKFTSSELCSVIVKFIIIIALFILAAYIDANESVLFNF